MTYKNDKGRKNSESQTQQTEKMQEKYFCYVDLQNTLKNTIKLTIVNVLPKYQILP